MPSEQQKPPKPHGENPSGDEPQGPAEQFMASVAVAQAQRDEREEEKSTDESRKTEVLHSEERVLARTTELARQVAGRLNQCAKQKAEELPTDRQAENPFLPDLTVERAWVKRRPKLMKRYERTPKVTEAYDTTLAQGWLLARGAVSTGKTPVIQEVMLGTDGKLHVYVPDFHYDVSEIIHNPASRQRMQESTHRNSMPSGGLSQVAPDIHGGSKQYHQVNTAPSTNKFVTIEDSKDFTNNQLDGSVPLFRQAWIIQQGLRDLVAETGINLETVQ